MRSGGLIHTLRIIVFGVVLLCLPALVYSQGGEGNDDLDKAFDLKVSARSGKELDQVVKLCESAIQKGLDEDEENNAKEMAASALFEHAEQLYFRIAPQDPSRKDRRWRILRSQAMSRLKKASRFKPELVDVYFLIAKLNVLPGGNRNAALEAIEKAIELTEDDQTEQSQALFLRASVQSDEKKTAGRPEPGDRA